MEDASFKPRQITPNQVMLGIVDDDSDVSMLFPASSKIIIYFEPFFRVKNDSQTSESELLTMRIPTGPKIVSKMFRTLTY